MLSQFPSFVCHGKKQDFTGYHVRSPADFPESVQSMLFEMLYPIALEAFRQNPSDMFYRDVHQHLFSYDNLIVVMNKGNPVAFRVWQVLSCKEKIMYLAGMCVKSTHQGIGIGEGLLRYILELSLREGGGFGSKYVAMRTQNPVMKKCFDGAMGGVSYPNGTEIPEDVKDVGFLVARHLNDEKYDRETLVSSCAYSGSLYGTPPAVVSEDSYVRTFQLVNVDRGDAVMCVYRRF